MFTVLISAQESIPRVNPFDLNYACQSGHDPVIIDARPAYALVGSTRNENVKRNFRREFDVFRIIGAISIPSEKATVADFEDIPRDRPVYIHGRSHFLTSPFDLFYFLNITLAPILWASRRP